MEPNFLALQVIAEAFLGMLGCSVILIGLNRATEGFSVPDNFRIQLLIYPAFGGFFVRSFLLLFLKVQMRMFHGP